MTDAERLDAIWRDVRTEVFGAPISEPPARVGDSGHPQQLDHDHDDETEND